MSYHSNISLHSNCTFAQYNIILTIGLVHGQSTKRAPTITPLFQINNFIKSLLLTTKISFKKMFTYSQQNILGHFLVVGFDKGNDFRVTPVGYCTRLHPGGGQNGKKNNGRLHCYLKQYHENTQQ